MGNLDKRHRIAHPELHEVVKEAAKVDDDVPLLWPLDPLPIPKKIEQMPASSRGRSEKCTQIHPKMQNQ